MRSSETIRRTNLTALCAAIIAAMLCLVLLALPLYDFSATVFTKKSGNTFVGDEKYVAVRAEVEAAAEARAAETGEMPQIIENVTERTNSKGEKTSMVAFEVRENMHRTGWDFIRSSLVSGKMLGVMALCVVAALICMVLGSAGSLSTDWHALAGRQAALRKIAGWLALVALILIPVFAMRNNLDFSRQIRLATDDLAPAGIEALLQKLDGFLYGGTAGADTLKLMSGVQFTARWTLWALLPLLGVMVLGPSSSPTASPARPSSAADCTCS